MNLSFDELTRFYHLLYVAYIQEGYICSYDRKEKHIVVWQKRNELWNSVMHYSTEANTEAAWYYDFMDDCVRAVHAFKFPTQ